MSEFKKYRLRFWVAGIATADIVARNEEEARAISRKMGSEWLVIRDFSKDEEEAHDIEEIGKGEEYEYEDYAGLLEEQE